MTREIFSNHIGNSSELTVVADIKQGFVPIQKPLTYAARLRIHLQMLSALRRNGLETDRAGVYVGPVDSLRTLQFVRWTLVENDTKMLLAVNFDRAFEPYLRRIVDVAGPLLDTILCHCEGFQGKASDQGYDKFASFVTDHQVPVELFVAAAPNVSVDDADYFVETDTMLRDGRADAPTSADEWPPTVSLTLPGEKLRKSARDTPLALLDQATNLLRVMYENEDRFPLTDFRGDESRDDLLYHNLTRSLVPGFWLRMRAGIQSIVDNAPQPIPGADQLLALDWEQSPPFRGAQAFFQQLAAAQPQNRRLVRTSELLNQFGEPLSWFAKRPPPRQVPSIPTITKGKIQRGLIRDDALINEVTVPKRGFIPTHACLLLFRVDVASAGAGFLQDMIPKIWPTRADEPINYNLSVTHNGLEALGISEEERRKFPSAFREGMEKRAGLLGDTDLNHPNEWNWPLANWPPAQASKNRRVAPSTVDIIIQVEAAPKGAPQAPIFDDQHPLFDEVNSLATIAGAHNVTLLGVEPMQRKFESHHGKDRVVSHLGFVDGVSQPHFDSNGDYDAYNPNTGEQKRDISALGYLLVGHSNKLELSELTTRYERPALLQDATFQVIRKISLDVPGFEEQATNFCPKPSGLTPQVVKAKIIGREADGTPLTANTTGLNDFNHASDPTGTSTPLQSHVRRANPREHDTPRLLRRGYSYGPYVDQNTAPDADRGLMFIAYNANIAEQFEVIQRWISGGNSTGISSWHGDPILAPKRTGGTRAFRFMNNDTAITVKMDDKPIGKLEWGVYAYVPSAEGLQHLITQIEQNPEPADLKSLVPPKVVPMLEMKSLEDQAAVDMSADEWKILLEDPDDENRFVREAVWEKIRYLGGALATDYGVLVGGSDQVLEVLENNDNAYSTREYWDRMTQSIGAQYLGYDEPPVPTKDPKGKELDTRYRDAVKAGDHTAESAELNKFLSTLSDESIFQQAYQTARAQLDALPVETQSLPDDGADGTSSNTKPRGRRVEFERLIYNVVAKLSVTWFGLPQDGLLIGGPENRADTKPHCPIDFLSGSFYVFGPQPTDHVISEGKTRAPMAKQAIYNHVQSDAPGVDGDLLKALRLVQNEEGSCPQRWTNEKIAEFMSGTCFGFVGPVSGSFRSVMFNWIKNNRLLRLHQRLKAQLDQSGADQFQASKGVLLQEIVGSMSLRPIPDLLHRTAVTPANIGGITIEAGDKIVISLRSAVAGGGVPETILFGGDYVNNPGAGPLHKCPGQSMGINTILGCISALLEYEIIEPESVQSVWIS